MGWYQQRVHGELFPDQWQSSNSRWARAKMRAGSPRSSCRCTRTASSLWTSTNGQLDKNDLRGAFDNVGVLMSESELDGLLGEISGPCTYDNVVKMFQEKMAGEGNDPDDLIVQAFKAYDNEGKIDSKMFEHALKTWGDKMTKAEIDDIFGEFE